MKTIALPLAIVLYLILATMWLGQPGPYYDEWIFVPVSLRALGACDIHAAVTHHLGCFPLTQAPPYVGALKAWLSAPFLGLFGVNAWSVRLPPVALGAAVLWWVHTLVRQRLGQRTAAWVVLALAIDAAMIWHTRLDWGPFAIANACKVLAFGCLLRWLESGRDRDLAWLLLAMTLGTFDKINFVWVTAALAIATLVLERRALLERLHAASRRQWAMLGVALALQLFALWALVLPAMSMPLPDVPESVPLAQRLTALRTLYDVTFGATSVYDWLFVDALPTPRWPAWTQAILLVLACVAGWRTRSETVGAAQLLRWSTAMVIVLLLCLLATRQVGGSHHVIVLWPFPMLQAACLAVLAWQRWSSSMQRRVLTGCMALALLGFATAQAATHVAFSRRLAAQGPYRPLFDPRLEAMAAYVRESSAHTVMSAHWGLHVALLSLSEPHARRGYRDWWPIFLDPPEADPARTAWLQQEFIAGGRYALVEWTAPELALPTQADAYLAAWHACPAGSREFVGSGGSPLARVRLFDAAVDGDCPSRQGNGSEQDATAR